MGEWRRLNDRNFKFIFSLNWRKVGDEYPIHSLLSVTKENGFECSFVDGNNKYFKYYKFNARDFDKLSEGDFHFVIKVYY